MGKNKKKTGSKSQVKKPPPAQIENDNKTIEVRKSCRQQVQGLHDELKHDLDTIGDYHLLIVRELDSRPDFTRLTNIYSENAEQNRIKDIITKHDALKELCASSEVELDSKANDAILKTVDRVTADNRMIVDRVREMITNISARQDGSVRSLRSSRSSKSGRSSGLFELAAQSRADLAEKEAKLETEKQAMEMEAKIEELDRQREILRRDMRATRAQGEIEAERERHQILLEAAEEVIRSEQENQPLQLPLHTSSSMKSPLFNNKLEQGKNYQQELKNPSSPYTGKIVDEKINQTAVSNRSDHALLADAFMEALQENQLPPPQPSVFKGSLIEYTDWRRSVNNFIAKRRRAPEDKLALLMSYLTDDIRKLVRGYSLTGTEDSWNEALQTLDEVFGDPFKQGEAFMDELDNWPQVSNTGKELRDFCGFLKQCIASMNLICTLKDLNTVKEMKRIIAKLPDSIRLKWIRKSTDHQISHGDWPALKDLVSFLQKEVKVACNPLNTEEKPPSRSTQPKTKKTAFSTTTERLALLEHCDYCTIDGHHLSACRKFTQIVHDKKLEFARSHGLCFACLTPGHMTKGCTDRAMCQRCSGRHPTSLHYDRTLVTNSYLAPQSSHQSPKTTTVMPQSTNQARTDSNQQAKHMTSLEAKNTTSTNSNSSKERTGLATGQPNRCANYSMTTPVWLSCGKDRQNEVLVYALHDTQSNASYLRSDIAAQLDQASKRKAAINLSTMTSQNQTIECLEIDNIFVRPIDSQEGILIKQLCTVDELPAMEEDIPTANKISQWPHLRELASGMENLPTEIPLALLRGYDSPAAFKPKEVVSSTEKEPFAIRYPLGWVIMGPTGARCNQPRAICHKVKANYPVQPKRRTILFTQKISEDFDRVISTLNQDFHQTQEKQGLSVEDRMFLKTMESELCRDEEGYISMPLPMKSEPKALNTRAMALHRFNLLTNKFKKDANYEKQYRTFMNEVISRGEAEKVDNTTVSGAWYIPHFGVYHPKKPDKLRVVFDASTKVQGFSLNDHLLEGPSHINSLQGILIRFRKEEIAIMCDIERMFHNFRVKPEDRDYLRFIWFDEDQKICDFRMKVHIFGAKSSPACATFGLRHLANTANCSTVTNFFRNDFYVDDGVTSIPTIKEGKELICESRKVCESGNIRLHKFVSNKPEVLSELPASEVSDISRVDLTVNCSELHNSTERTLGLQWDINSDSFQFAVTNLQKPNTRRGILSTVASLYDPLGLISPFTMVGKSILQSLCRQGIEWDTPLDAKTEAAWTTWKRSTTDLPSLTISRNYKLGLTGNIVKKELHNFSDASTTGYGQCSYLRLVDDADNVQVTLIMSKARVAPLKVVSIPRLELQAACTSVEMSSFVKDQLQITQLEEFFWTDSKVVLAYIHNESRRFQVYVANRVQKIRDYTEPKQWFYIPTNLNPADLASRGASPCQLQSSSWFRGPDYLQKVVVNMPHQEFSRELDGDNDPEVKQVSLATLKRPCLLHNRLNSFSDWSSAIRSITFLEQFIRQKTGRYNIDSISARQNAERTVLLALQKEHFEEELQCLRSGVLVKRSSKLAKLSPQLDHDGVIRVGGRLQESTLSYAEKHPIIVPKSYIGELLLRHYHEKTAHQGRELTLARLRLAGYWVIGAKSMVSSIIHHCVICRKNRGKPATQMMAPLPLDRTKDAPPFTYIGIDCFGPFIVRDGRKEVKRWGLIATCMSSRAVHLELLEDMTSDSFINALRILTAIRGKIRQIRCDHGSNFVGALSELRVSAKTKWSKELEVEFLFNPPHASHMGGAWERHIRSVRSILKGISSKYGGRFSTQTLRTVFYEISAIINSRPLNTVSHDGVPLNPNMLLTMKTDITLPPPGKFEDTDVYSRKRWLKVQAIANQFWHRFRSSYLNELQHRNKWQKPTRNMKVGDIVCVNEGDCMRNDWKLARVVECKLSNDGLVRSVKVKLGRTKSSGNTVIERPINKIILLVEAE